MKKILLLLFVLFCGSWGISQTTLKVLNWNVYMLPDAANLSKIIKKSHKLKRAKAIAEMLQKSDYDIVVLQETFHIPSRNALKKLLKDVFPHQYGPMFKAFFKTNDGTLILSKTPLHLLKKVMFKDCSSTDCLAKKGAPLLASEKDGKKFQILATHLNSIVDDQAVRDKQYIQLYEELLRPFEQQGVAQILCGDMNTNQYDSTAYQSMLEKFDAEDIATQSEQKNTFIEGDYIIDYILLRKNNSNIKVLDKQIKFFKANFELIPYLKGNLSDHLAVEVLFKL